jgi:hypothetical protein
MSGGAYAQASQASHLPPQGLVRQIDHIVVVLDEPETLFRLFSEKLKLPVVWPFASHGAFSSGGVGFGNVNIEVAGDARLHSGLARVALDSNSLSEVLAGLDARGLQHGPPKPYYQENSSGVDHLLWTTVLLTELPPAREIFFCKFSFDVDKRRAKIKRELQKNGGGSLGVDSVKELVIGVHDIAAARRDWANLLGPIDATQEPVWQVGSGPAIRLIEANEDQLKLLRVKVKSLGRARVFLKAEGLLGLDTEREIAIDRNRVAGADIRLVE